ISDCEPGGPAGTILVLQRAAIGRRSQKGTGRRTAVPGFRSVHAEERRDCKAGANPPSGRDLLRCNAFEHRYWETRSLVRAAFEGGCTGLYCPSPAGRDRVGSVVRANHHLLRIRVFAAYIEAGEP